jgi:hypothetical protein
VRNVSLIFWVYFQKQLPQIYADVGRSYILSLRSTPPAFEARTCFLLHSRQAARHASRARCWMELMERSPASKVFSSDQR